MLSPEESFETLLETTAELGNRAMTKDEQTGILAHLIYLACICATTLCKGDKQQAFEWVSKIVATNFEKEIH